ncbi:MAG: hypothetical protein ACKOD9_13255, partial [Rubrivivax sp.]
MKNLALVVAACCAAAPAIALDRASSTASSASSAGSASVGSVSDSLRSSSQSATGPRQMAAGDYRVIAVAEVPGRPDELWLTLQAQALDRPSTPTAPQTASTTAGGTSVPAQWELRLPRLLAERERLAAGQLLRATPQPYG